MSRHSWVAVAAVVALALPVVALSATPLTVAQYRAQVNALCKTDGKQVDALSLKHGLAAYLTAALKVTQSSVRSLSKLDPPASLATFHNELIANVTAGFPIIRGLIARAKAGKLTVQQFSKDPAVNANVTRTDALWTKIGATAC